jgi:hypothetical protein
MERPNRQDGKIDGMNGMNRRFVCLFVHVCVCASTKKDGGELNEAYTREIGDDFPR